MFIFICITISLIAAIILVTTPLVLEIIDRENIFPGLLLALVFDPVFILLIVKLGQALL